MKKRQVERAAPPTADVIRIAVTEVTRVNAEQRTIDLVLATETPVPVFDMSRMEVIDEIIRIDGIKLPKQVPLLDSHQRDSVRSVSGSIRDLRREKSADGPVLVGRAHFAADAESVRTFEAYRDGHLTDFSVGATRGEVKYEGGKRIIVRSELVEGSTVVRGADPNAKALPAALRAYTDPQGAMEDAMTAAVKEKLIARGLPADADDNAVLAFIDKMGDKTVERFDAKVIDELERKYVGLEKTITDALTHQADAAKELHRRTEIDGLCRTHGVEDTVHREYIDGNKSVEDVAKAILARKAEAGAPLGAGPILSGKSGREKFYNACRDSMVIRSLQGGGVVPSRALERARLAGESEAIQRSTELVAIFDKPADGTREMRNVGLMDMARMFCEQAGERVYGLPNQEIVKRALGVSNFVQRASDGPAYNTTGSFANLLLEATHKTLLAAYDEANTTYQLWVRTAPSASDFRRLNRIRFGELPDPEIVPENHEYPEKTAGDNRESYQVEKYGELFSITWEAIVNDDMNAISRIPAMQGAAMRRKVNKVVYEVLTRNATMSDAIALFHATSHGANLDTDALAESALDTGFSVMAQQTGLSGSGTILNIQPRFLIVPAGLGATARRLVSGMFYPTGATGIPLYGEGRARPLTVIEDAQLDANSATKWYLAADTSQVDTVELTFLRGEESPVMDREEGFTTDTVKYKIRQTFAAAAIDYRGLYKSGT